MEGVCDNPGQIFSYIDNLERLKLIDIPAGIKIFERQAYDEIENCLDIKQIMNMPLPEGSNWQIVHKKFEVTYFVKQFIDVCVRDKE